MTAQQNSMTEGKPWRDGDLLEEKYVLEDMTAVEMADEWGVATKTVTDWLRRNDIEVTNGHISELRDKQWLKEKYKDEELSVQKIGEALGCDPKTVHNWLNRHNIETRHPGWGSHPGEENPNWRGGEHDTLYYGNEWPEIRERCLERDGYKCRACGISESEHKEQMGKGLTAHHVVPVRNFDQPEDAHSLGNLVATCRSCHKRFEGLPVFPKR